MQKKKLKRLKRLSRAQKRTLLPALKTQVFGALGSATVPLHQPFEVVALVDRAGWVGEAAAQLFHDAARALGGADGFLKRPLLASLLAFRAAA